MKLWRTSASPRNVSKRAAPEFPEYVSCEMMTVDVKARRVWLGLGPLVGR